MKKFKFIQRGTEYNLYDLPADFVLDGDLNLSGLGLTELPDLSNVIVYGNVDISHNNLTSLKGMVKEVKKNFNCSHNQLIDLVGGPKTVAGTYRCANNNLTSLKGIASHIGGSLFCSANKLQSLEFISEYIGRNFDFSDNDVRDFTFYPKVVKGHIICRANRFETRNIEKLISNKEGLVYRAKFRHDGKILF